jgi:SAM-dependent methyltransferase
VKALITEIPSRVGRLVAGRLLPLNRDAIAARYLQGDGLEIGALHNPLPVPSGARVRCVDRMPVAELERHYPELRDKTLVPVDVIDDGERLGSVRDASVDFVIANHFLEHCQDPIGALGTMFRVVRPGGIVYLAVPDKRYTFDVDRDVTQPEHVLDDHRNSPEGSKRRHYEEWCPVRRQGRGGRRRRACDEAARRRLQHPFPRLDAGRRARVARRRAPRARPGVRRRGSDPQRPRERLRAAQGRSVKTLATSLVGGSSR